MLQRRHFLVGTSMVAAGLVTLRVAERPSAPVSPMPAQPTTSASTLASHIESILYFPERGNIVPPESIPAIFRAARADYRGTRYTQLVERLGTLLASAEAAVIDQPGRATDAWMTQTYNAVTSLLFKLPASKLEWISTNRATRAAQRTENPHLIAETRRQFAIAQRRAGRPDMTMDIAVQAAETLLSQRHPALPANLAGHLYCTAAYGAARKGDRARTYELLAEAKKLATIAETLPPTEWDHFAAAVQVDVYGISCATALGDPGTALRYIRAVPLDALPTTERKGRYLVDAATAFTAAGQPQQAVRALAAAARIAPQETRNRPAATSLASTLRHIYPGAEQALRAV